MTAALLPARAGLHFAVRKASPLWEQRQGARQLFNYYSTGRLQTFEGKARASRTSASSQPEFTGAHAKILGRLTQLMGTLLLNFQND